MLAKSETISIPLRVEGSRGALTSLESLIGWFRWTACCVTSLRQFIRRGTMTFTTANGEKFTCGDGTGEPVAVRFLTTDAERRVLLDPELALGEVYMEGTFVVEQGTIADALAILLDQPDILPRWRSCNGGCAIWSGTPCNSIRPRDRSTMSRTITTSMAGSIRSSSTPTGNTAAPISKRRTRRLMMRSSPRSGIWRQSC